MRIIFYVFIIVFGIEHVSYGRPSKSLQEKLIKLRRFNQNLNASKRKNQTQRLTHAILPGTYPQTSREKLTFKLDDVLSACRHERGDVRTFCVASLVRRMYPGHFKHGNNKEQHSRRKSQETPDDSISSTTHRVTRTYCHHPTSASSTTTEAPPVVKQQYNQGKNRLFALLITPNGKKKRVFPITQQVDVTDIDRPLTKEQLICKSEELGFDPVIDARYSTMVFDMMCALCQYHNDTDCINRYCTAYPTTTRSPT